MNSYSCSIHYICQNLLDNFHLTGFILFSLYVQERGIIPMENDNTYQVVFVGPEFTFSHQASREAVPLLVDLLKSTGDSAVTANDFRLVPKNGNEEIESSIEFDPNAFAVIPISNSDRGDVYRFLPFCSYEKVAEIHLTLSFCLCSYSPLERIEKLATMRVAYEQVRDAIEDILPSGVDRVTHINPEITTAKAVQLASEDHSIAAICSEEAAKNYGVPVLKHRLEGDEKRETTFYVFRNPVHEYSSPPPEIASEFNFLLRGSRIYSGTHLNAGVQAFAERMKTREPLHIKWGIDPIHESLHLGHLANLLKLRDFLTHGHKATIVMGTFTGIIADPSGNLTQRPPIQEKVLDKNSQRIIKEINGILGEDSYDVVYNHELIKEFDLRKFLKWMRNTDIRFLMDRPDFQNRLKFSHQLSSAEFIYPLFQAFDTVHIQPDLELGGADQVWNCVLSKDIMQQEGFTPPFIMLLDELPGIDGSPKMSSFEKNAIHLAESKDEIRRKIMGLPSSVLYQYYLNLTRIDMAKLANMRQSLHNRKLEERDKNNWKERLADELLSLLKRK